LLKLTNKGNQIIKTQKKALIHKKRQGEKDSFAEQKDFLEFFVNITGSSKIKKRVWWLRQSFA